MPLTTGKSNTLVRLTADPDLGPEAARYLQSFQRQLRDEEIWKTRQLITDRLNAAKTSNDLLSSTNSIFRNGLLLESESLLQPKEIDLFDDLSQVR